MGIYTEVSVSNYNTNPPDDDGTQASSNEIEWAKHKTKLSDPLKTALESINTNLASAFGKVFLNGSSTISTNTTLGVSDHGKLKLVSNSPTVSLGAAATLGAGWNCALIMTGSGTATIDPNGSETINGGATMTISGEYDWIVLYCDGSNIVALAKPSDVDVSSAFPVGSIYYNYDDSTNPATLLGFGTWVAMQDRMLIGAGGTYTAGDTGGSATTTQSSSQIATHDHNIPIDQAGNSTNSSVADAGTTADSSLTTGSAGSGSAMTTISPYVAVYMWRRTV